MSTFGGVTATVIKRGAGARDARNNPTVADIGGNYALAGCRLDQIKSDEILVDRDSIVSTYLLIAPPPPTGKTVTYLDELTIAGVRYSQVGDPDELANFDATAHHLELVLRKSVR